MPDPTAESPALAAFNAALAPHYGAAPGASFDPCAILAQIQPYVDPVVAEAEAVGAFVPLLAQAATTVKMVENLLIKMCAAAGS